jgi:hypothetical protein
MFWKVIYFCPVIFVCCSCSCSCSCCCVWSLVGLPVSEHLTTKNVFRVLYSPRLLTPPWIVRISFHIYPFAKFARVSSWALALFYPHTLSLIWSRVSSCRRCLATLPGGERHILEDISRTLTAIFANIFTLPGQVTDPTTGCVHRMDDWADCKYVSKDSCQSSRNILQNVSFPSGKSCQAPATATHTRPNQTQGVGVKKCECPAGDPCEFGEWVDVEGDTNYPGWSKQTRTVKNPENVFCRKVFRYRQADQTSNAAATTTTTTTTTHKYYWTKINHLSKHLSQQPCITFY